MVGRRQEYANRLGVSPIFNPPKHPHPATPQAPPQRLAEPRMNADFFKKLHLEPGQRFLALNVPDGYVQALADSTGVAADTAARRGDYYACVHLFVTKVSDLELYGPVALNALVDDGFFWVSYPKKSSGVETEMSRDHNWDMLLKEGWRPVTALSVDDVWSCLRFRHQTKVKVDPRTRQARIEAGSAQKRVHKPIAVPPDLLKALEEAPVALKTFEAFAYTHRREYVEWVTDAKRPETRQRRIEKTVALVGQGKKFS